MCTLYRLASATQEIARIFDAVPQTSLDAPLSVYPGRLAPVVGHGRAADGRPVRVLGDALWGVSPPAGKAGGGAGGRPVVNIRNLASPFWRNALSRPALRCLVPADSFCEWTDLPDPVSGRRRQMFFGLADGAPFAFAGLIRPAPAGSGEPPRFAFLTCAPNGLVAPVHAKAMPVILGPKAWTGWLEGAPAEAFQQPVPDAALKIVE